MDMLGAQPDQLRRAPPWRLRLAVADIVWPSVWLVLGLVASTGYLFGAALVPAPFSQNLPEPLYPPEAIVVAVLLLTPQRRWWLLLAQAYVFQVAVFLWMGYAPAPTLAGHVANVVEPLLAAVLVRLTIEAPLRFDSLRQFSLYAVCVSVASVVGATLGAASLLLTSRPYWPTWQAWFLGDVLANLLLAPTILLCAHRLNAGRPLAVNWRLIEVALIVLALLATGMLGAGSRVDDPRVAQVLRYMPVPLLLWAAVRFGPLGVAGSLSLITILAIAGVAHGRGPFVAASSEESVLGLQMFLIVIGVPLFFLAALVRERQVAQTLLEQSQERYRAVVAGFPHGVVLLFGPDLHHLFADGEGLPEIGLSRESVEGKAPWEAFPPDIASTLLPHYRAALEGMSSSFDLRHADRIYRAHVLPVRSGDEVVGMAVMQDVTEERRAEALAVSEAALRVANAHLNELSRAKSELLSVVSHEVRTPLVGIRGFSEMIRDDMLGPEKVAEYASIINREARRLGRLVDDLLDLEQLESGRAGLHPETVDLHAIIAEAVERAKPIADGHSFVIAVEPSVPVVRADPDKLMQILANLFDNAIKYSPNGGTITIGGSAEGHYAHLWIRDEGLGLPPDSLEAVFDRYARVDSAGHRAIKGSGLGLPIVRQIAELHGGRSWAESVPGHGSTFHVTLAIDGPPTPEAVRRPDGPPPQ